MQLVQQLLRANKFLDIILSTHLKSYFDVENYLPVLPSDHDLILCKWKSSVKKPRQPAIK